MTIIDFSHSLPDNQVVVVDGADLDCAVLAARTAPVSSLTINRVRAKEVPGLAGLAALPLTHLRLRWLSAPDLIAVPLPATLRVLSIWQSKITRLDGIAAAPLIEQVDLRETSGIDDLTPLAALPHLTALSIEGGYGSGQKIASLEGLEACPALTRLGMRAIDGGALDLGPITRLPRLAELDLFTRHFAPEEVARVAAAYPWFHAQLLDLATYNLRGMNCKKCGGAKKEMFLKGRKFLWCAGCEATGLAKILAGFEAMVEAAKQAGDTPKSQ